MIRKLLINIVVGNNPYNIKKEADDMNKYFQLKHEYKNSLIKYRLFKILYIRKHRKIFRNYACDITPGCKLGKVVFRHPIGIIIGGGADLKDGVIIHQNVTFGALRFDSKERRGIFCRQILDEDTIICTGAKILGDVTIGKNCIIGANAIVTKDVPDNTVVIGYNKHLINKNHRNGCSYE